MKHKLSSTPTTEQTGFSPPSPSLPSTLVIAGNSLEVTTCTTQSKNLAKFRRLSGKTYLDNSTGEVKEYQPRQYGSVNTADCNRAFQALRRLLLANSERIRYGQFVTLTLMDGQELTPPSLYRYFSAFWKRLHRTYPELDYIVAVEYGKENYRIHYHMFTMPAIGHRLRISEDELSLMWGRGGVRAQPIHTLDRLVNYVCSNEKRRLWALCQSPGQKLYHCSRNVNRPTVLKMSREEVDTYVREGQYTNGRATTYQVRSNDGRIYNTIYYEQFKRK